MLLNLPESISQENDNHENLIPAKLNCYQVNQLLF
jgi:hypothetical protein